MNKHDWQDDRISGAYREHTGLEPPAALDEAIRAAARRAVRSGPRPAWKDRFARWQVPLAAAATIVLSASLLLVIRDEQPAVLQSPAAETALALKGPLESKIVKPPAEMPAPPPPGVKSPQPAYILPKPTFVPTPEAQIRQEPRDGDGRERVPAPLSAAPERAERRAETAPAAGDAPSLKKKAMADGAIAGAAAEAKADAAQAASAGVYLQKDHSAAAAPAPPASAAVVARSTVMTPPAYAAPRAAPVPAPEKREDASAELKFAETAKAGKAPASPAPAASEKTQGAALEAPAAWIARMETLRATGKWKELRAELERFRKAYPQAALPKALQELPPEEK